MIVIPDLSGYTKTENHRKEFRNLPKNARNNNLLKTSMILNTNIEAK